MEYIWDVLTFPLKLKLLNIKRRTLCMLEIWVEVVTIAGHEDLYGVLVNIRCDGKDYVFRLCDLQAVDEDSLTWRSPSWIMPPGLQIDWNELIY
ncbi:MAG: calcium-binding protein [Desulfovermiculus sp.]|nr:calcium-binding protein [Desulfovermiculus sp.]